MGSAIVGALQHLDAGAFSDSVVTLRACVRASRRVSPSCVARARLRIGGYLFARVRLAGCAYVDAVGLCASKQGSRSRRYRAWSEAPQYRRISYAVAHGMLNARLRALASVERETTAHMYEACLGYDSASGAARARARVRVRRPNEHALDMCRTR